jgi:hypothetical protein
MSNGNNVHAAANGRNIWVPDPCLTLAENHENILLRPDLDRYILSLNAITALPQLLVVTCTDFRVGVSNLERLAAGQAFIQKPAGGFIIQNIEDDLSLSAAFSVVCGLKKVVHIIQMTHSDCAAAKIAQKFPEVGMIGDDVPNAADLRVIQSYVLRVSNDIPVLSDRFARMATQGAALPPEDMMAIQLGLRSVENLKKMYLYDGKTTTVGEKIARGEVCLTQLHLDLGKKDDRGEYVRLPALYRYHPAEKNRYSVLKQYTKPEAQLVVPEGHCDCCPA